MPANPVSPDGAAEGLRRIPEFVGHGLAVPSPLRGYLRLVPDFHGFDPAGVCTRGYKPSPLRGWQMRSNDLTHSQQVCTPKESSEAAPQTYERGAK